MVVSFFAGVEQAPVGGFNPMMIIMMVGMLGLLFFMQRRARKQAAERDQFRSHLVVGQRVMTQGGLVGTIVQINDAADTVVIDSAGSRCEYARRDCKNFGRCGNNGYRFGFDWLDRRCATVWR